MAKGGAAAEVAAKGAAVPLRVFACDQSERRARQVARAAEICGAPITWLRPDVVWPELSSPESHGAAIVGFDTVTAPKPHAYELLRRLKALGIGSLVLLDGASKLDIASRCRALVSGAAALIDSGEASFEDELVRLLGQSLQQEARRRSADEQLSSHMSSLGVVGVSRAMRSVFALVTRIARLSDLAALLTGESGTGKELIARALHQLDPKRREQPFVAVNCAAISPGIAESELFGHRRGAFTGAERERKGLFREADQGVLFLDEIGELSLDLQGKLLRVLQTGRVTPVGHDTEQPVDVRVLAATNRDLEALVSEKRFRLDLYHRINVLTIRLPTLRERAEDVPSLVHHFVAKYAGRPAETADVSADFIEALASVELPGNVRQLENIVRSTLVYRQGTAPLALQDLPEDVLRQLVAADGPANADPCEAGEENRQQVVHLLRASRWNLSTALSQCEQMMVRAAMAQAQGNQSRAARLLGISPRSLYNKLHRPELR